MHLNFMRILIIYSYNLRNSKNLRIQENLFLAYNTEELMMISRSNLMSEVHIILIY